MRATKRLALIVAAIVVVLGVAAAAAYATLSDDNTAPVTTPDAVASYWNGATITLNATDDANGVAYIYYHLDGRDEYTHVLAVGTGLAKATVTVAPPASGSATHTLKFWAQDGAGNVEVAHAVDFAVGEDKVAPTTTFSGVKDGAWSKAPVVVHLAAADNDGGSGLDTLTAILDDGTPAVVHTASTDVTIPAATTHANDGKHTLKFQAVDVAGNTEDQQTLTVHIDTTKPVTKALAAVTIRRGRSGSPKYSVADASPTANVTIKVKNSHGKVVKTFTAKAASTGASHTVKLTVPRTWKAGTYHFYVYATDLAGNGQANVASNKIVVK